MNKKLTDTLVKLIREDIRRKGIIDTGKMLNSISVTLKNSANGYTLDISAEDYFQYQDKRYNILDDVLNTREWNNTFDDVMVELIENSIG
jgi:hypothetical protein